MALILLFGISASSANEINNADVDGIGTSYVVETNNLLTKNGDASNNNVEKDISQKNSVSLENTKSNPSKENIGSSNDIEIDSIQTDAHDDDTNGAKSTISKTSNQSDTNNNKLTSTQTNKGAIADNNQINEDKTSHLTVTSTSIVNGKELVVHLKNSAGEGISGQKITITFNNKKYTEITDANGQCNLKINSKTGTYPVTIIYDGDENHLPDSKSFTIEVYKEKTKITLTSTSIINGNYLYVYLKDSIGLGISGQKITITLNNKKYTKTTNANGRISLKMNSKTTKYYTIKVKYAESTSYLATSKSFKVKVYKLKTKITINSKSILRGKYLYVLLKDSDGNALSSKKVTIKINKKTFKKYTNKNGEAKLKITSKSGKYPVKITYAGSTTYSSTSNSFTLKSYIGKTKITVSNSKVIKGNYLYAYLKNSANKPISKQKITITFNNKKYTKTTNSNGKISLKLNVKAGNYKTIIKYSGSISYKSNSKTLTIKVIANTNAKIIATDKITKGSYSVRLVDNLGAPIINKQITIYTYNGTQSAGSKISITKKTIVLDSDHIYNTEKDTKLLNDIATILRNKGYNVIVNTNINPNAHCSDIMGKYTDVCILCIFGGVDSGMFVDMSSKWYQNYLKKYNNEVVLGFTKTSRNLATETWLERAHDDNYSPNTFTGLANPGTYLNENGFDYIYGNTAKQLAENFLNYAIKGLSIGKDNILPGVSNTYNVITDANGYATIYGINEGYYKVISSCSDTGYVVDSVTSYLTVK